MEISNRAISHFERILENKYETENYIALKSNRIISSAINGNRINNSDNRFSFKLCPLNIYHTRTSILK